MLSVITELSVHTMDQEIIIMEQGFGPKGQRQNAISMNLQTAERLVLYLNEAVEEIKGQSLGKEE